jgi:outer membrane protein assembly factor BamB
MMRSVLFARTVLAGVGFLALVQVAPVLAQDREEGPDPAKEAVSSEVIPPLRADPALVRKLEAARDNLQAEAWSEGTHLVQELLDRPEDALVAVKVRGKDGRAMTRWTGLHTEAVRLLAALPPGGREFYEARYGPRARALLAQARAQGDPEKAAEVVRRYPLTAAAVEAGSLLASYALDRGQYHRAALEFEQLLDRQGADELPPVLLFRAALAFRRAGDRAQADQAWRWLTATAPAGLRLGGRSATLAELHAELERIDLPKPAPAPRSFEDLELGWSQDTYQVKPTRVELRIAVTQQEYRSRAVLPAFFPVPAGRRLYYRSYGGVHAVDLRTGKETWEAPSAWSADRLANDPRHGSYFGTWVESYRDFSPHVLFSNAVLGTLSTDGARVYAVDDLAVPPYKPFTRFRPRWQQEPPWPDYDAELNDAVAHNQLLALDAATGKKVWELGDRGGERVAGRKSESFFLGPPLPLDGRLYVLTEKNGELALSCLRPADGTLLWKQALTAAPTRLPLDPGRRIQAARPLYADGILICPTNAGVVLGVDLLTRSLAWAYPYRSESLTQSPPWWGRRGRAGPARIVAEWAVPRVVVRQGKVVFAAPDSGVVHCLRLRDGTPLWTAERGDGDLFLAGGWPGKVLVVGKEKCRALDLADGAELWQLETGLPSGYGVSVGDVYYLPLKEAGKEKEPAVCILDVDRGTVLARSPAPGGEVPGNLLFWQGRVVSQTASDVAVYKEPKRKGK